MIMLVRWQKHERFASFCPSLYWIISGKLIHVDFAREPTSHLNHNCWRGLLKWIVRRPCVVSQCHLYMWTQGKTLLQWVPSCWMITCWLKGGSSAGGPHLGRLECALHIRIQINYTTTAKEGDIRKQIELGLSSGERHQETGKLQFSRLSLTQTWNCHFRSRPGSEGSWSQRSNLEPQNRTEPVRLSQTNLSQHVDQDWKMFVHLQQLFRELEAQ